MSVSVDAKHKQRFLTPRHIRACIASLAVVELFGIYPRVIRIRNCIESNRHNVRLPEQYGFYGGSLAWLRNGIRVRAAPVESEIATKKARCKSGLILCLRGRRPGETINTVAVRDARSFSAMTENLSDTRLVAPSHAGARCPAHCLRSRAGT